MFFGNNILCHNTDSVQSDTLIRTNTGIQTIEHFFDQAKIKWCDGDKEYASDDRLGVVSYHDGDTKLGPFDFIYRHKVSKKKFAITDSGGNRVVVTEDHSVMVCDEFGELVERKPVDLRVGDRVVSVC